MNHDSYVTYSQTNHVILVKSHGRQCLKNVFNTLKYGIYKPTTYSAITQRLVNPKATAIIFSTGNITNMGCKTYFGALRTVLHIKRSLGLEIINVKLTNIVINFSVSKFGIIDMDDLYEKTKGQSTYDPVIFPCITYGIQDTKIKANIFQTGKVVITGCKSKDTIHTAIDHVTSVIMKSLRPFQTPNDESERG